MAESENGADLVHISAWKFLIGCAAAAAVLFFVGRAHPFTSAAVAAEVLLAVLALFIFGSIRTRIDKNAVTYGGSLVVAATAWSVWWPGSALRARIQAEGLGAVAAFFRQHFFTFQGLDRLVHLDTMLFILGLTFFVAVIAQTRLLESVSLLILEKTKGGVVATVGLITALVSFASGILDGVSMIGLLIRILIVLLMLARVKKDTLIFSVLVSTVITTVCGMWLAYGEPPNLIMKASLHPYLNDLFFIRFCLPVAIASYLVVFWNIRKELKGLKIDVSGLDVMDRHMADVKFLRVVKHGVLQTPVELIESMKEMLGPHFEGLRNRLMKLEPLGPAMIREGIPEPLRRSLWGAMVSEPLAEDLDRHYLAVVHENAGHGHPSMEAVRRSIELVSRDRVRTQIVGGLAFIPFVGLLVAHAVNHEVPLFLSSFAGFAAAFLGILSIPKMRTLALKEAGHEYLEYLFLFPLFFCISVLVKVGFFEVLSHYLMQGIHQIGATLVGLIQFYAGTVLSALLDNNVVADFTSKALRGLEEKYLHLFAMAQIAGYALGGCWTHIGSAQSVVAYAFVRKNLDANFTPWRWIKAVTKVLLQLLIVITAIIILEGWIVSFVH